MIRKSFVGAFEWTSGVGSVRKPNQANQVAGQNHGVRPGAVLPAAARNKGLLSADLVTGTRMINPA
jgi:hypothetical protein